MPEHEERDIVAVMVERIAGEHGLTFADLRSRDQRRGVHYARQRAMAVLSWSTGLSHVEIGAIFGRDRSSVDAAILAYERSLNTDNPWLAIVQRETR